MKKIIATKTLTLLALLFHIVGFVGMGIWQNTLVYKATPYHLALMFVLLLLSFSGHFKQFFLWLLFAYAATFGVEWIGVHKGWLFGIYTYTAALGYSLQHIPLLIGCNWVIVLAGAICLAAEVSTYWLLNAFLAACCTTIFDWILEPVAVKLNYWHWSGGIIPIWNYASWWLVTFILAIIWNKSRVQGNQFAVNLFIIQLLFFALLRSVL